MMCKVSFDLSGADDGMQILTTWEINISHFVG